MRLDHIDLMLNFCSVDFEIYIPLEIENRRCALIMNYMKEATRIRGKE